MDAVEFLKQFNRMCEAYDEDGFCKNCPAYEYNCCANFNGQENDVVQIVEQWTKEHPVKTRQSEFLKMYPDTEMLESGCLNICPTLLSKEYRNEEANECNQPDFNCGKCKRDFWLKEIE